VTRAHAPRQVAAPPAPSSVVINPEYHIGYNDNVYFAGAPPPLACAGIGAV
jgi:hypothetical protein